MIKKYLTSSGISLALMTILAFTFINSPITTIFNPDTISAATEKTEKDVVDLEKSEDEESTSSASSDNDTKASETTKNLKDRIQKIVEEKNQEVQGAIDDLSKVKRGFIGTVIRVTEETITVKNSKGTNILPYEDEVVLLKDKKKITLDKVAVDDWALVMGWVEDDSFVPKKIVVSSKSLRPNNHLVMLGTIEDMGKTQIAFKSRSSETADVLKLSKSIEYQDNTGKETDKENFSENSQALIVGYEDEGTSTATVIRSLAPFNIGSNDTSNENIEDTE